MSNKNREGLPSGIVRFTITEEKLKDILSEIYNENIKSFSVEEDGISIKLSVPEKKEEESHFEEENEEEGELEEGVQQF